MPWAQAGRLSASLEEIRHSGNLDEVRGLEGEAVFQYFRAFNALQSTEPTADGFEFTKRTRRPPLDRINAVLSFIYTLLLHDMRSACEATGLDSCVAISMWTAPASQASPLT